MIQKNTKTKSAFRLSKTALTAIVLLTVMILSIGGYHLAKRIKTSDDPGNGQTAQTKVIYDTFSLTGDDMDTFELTVEPDDPALTSYRITKESGQYVFYLSVYNEVTGEYELFRPDVVDEDPFFTYSDIYATDSFGDYGEIWRLYYLSAGIGTVYYSEAIENVAPEDLYHYGLDDGEATRFTVRYKENGDTENHELSVLIGDLIPGGTGYYVCLESDRTTVYPTSTNTLSYVEQPFSYYIKPRLVASGLTFENTNGVFNDSSYEPYLTSDFKEWKNTMVAYDENKQAQKNVPASFDDVADLVLSLKQTSDETKYEESTLYRASYLSFSETLQNKIKAQTAGKSLGANVFSVTDVDTSAAGMMNLLENPDTAVTYTITKIHAAVTDGADVLSGTVGDARYVLVTFTKDGGTETYDGAFDLEKMADAASEKEIAAIRAAEVGTDVELSLTVTYGETAADSYVRQKLVTGIAYILDETGNDAETVTASSTVIYYYEVQINGEYLGWSYAMVNLSDDTAENIGTLRSILIGKTAGSTFKDAVIETTTHYAERVYRYTRLSVASVEYYVERKLIAGFAYKNVDERDPFYAETYYVNTIEGSPYGVDATVCEDIARRLGGLAGDSSTSAGLYGTETLAVGLTPDVMADYGLYAYTVYYELPRDIYADLDEDDQTTLFYSYYKLGTYLYVSEKNADGTRYVGSSLYGVVTKVDASVFDFLDGTFNDTFARKDLAMVAIENVTDVNVSCRLDELKGDYEIVYRPTAATNSDGTPVYTYAITPSGELTETKLTEYLTATGKTSANLNNFYYYVSGMYYFVDENGRHDDLAGKSYFREWIRILWSTDYTGELEDGEAAINGKDPLLSISFTLTGGNVYTYRFYRVSDRQIAVRLEFPEKDASQDFYISTLAFKKICNGFGSLLNAEVVDGDLGYGD